MVLGRSGSAFVGHVGQALSDGQAPGSGFCELSQADIVFWDMVPSPSPKHLRHGVLAQGHPWTLLPVR